MAPISENDDFIKRLVETRNYELEKIYLGMIDLMERGFNPKKLIIEIKNEKEKTLVCTGDLINHRFSIIFPSFLQKQPGI